MIMCCPFNNNAAFTGILLYFYVLHRFLITSRLHLWSRRHTEGSFSVDESYDLWKGSFRLVTHCQYLPFLYEHSVKTQWVDEMFQHYWLKIYNEHRKHQSRMHSSLLIEPGVCSVSSSDSTAEDFIQTVKWIRSHSCNECECTVIHSVTLVLLIIQVVVYVFTEITLLVL